MRRAARPPVPRAGRGTGQPGATATHAGTGRLSAATVANSSTLPASPQSQSASALAPSPPAAPSPTPKAGPAC